MGGRYPAKTSIGMTSFCDSMRLFNLFEKIEMKI